MTLGDLSNAIIVELQQPNASFTVGGGGNPNWQANQQYSQGLVEFWINQAYIKLLGDLEDLELVTVSFTLTSLVNTYKYAIPPSGYAPISHVSHVFYQPKGLPYNMELRPGSGLISWSEFQGKWTGEGYLSPYAFGTQPYVVAIDPLLANLYFFTGSAQAGDTITVYYSPLPAKGATGCPTLVAETDTPLLPIDTHIAIYYYAMSKLWMRGREMEAAKMNLELYEAEKNAIRAKYTRKTHGDILRIEPFADDLSISRWSL